jgi:hypothetical protein
MYRATLAALAWKVSANCSRVQVTLETQSYFARWDYARAGQEKQSKWLAMTLSLFAWSLFCIRRFFEQI